MAFEKVAKLQGSEDVYALSPDLKKYTLRDNSFEELKTGNFQYLRTLTSDSAVNQEVKLKIIISEDLSKLKIATTTMNGLRPIIIYKGDAFKEIREKYEFIMQDFLNKSILEKK
ncbi:Putative amino acid metabolism [Carnobacterium iners]|uniref:Putative amino acid metabolism n=1 Tax=Carnobacterium iners TaxID=1073423 RepID=A0A1X7NMW7_9LACT|nr:cysteine desulfurase [Carnobacterium iners]SEK69204.1 Putative amino acid metabolism [Carnobacterium iners]SMH38893.1 Putative amino acid metabolism [Carnobacterium iners]